MRISMASIDRPAPVVHVRREKKDSVAYRAIAKTCPTLEIDPTKNWQFLVLACDGLFDVMTNQQVVDWINSELQSRARTMRHVVRHHLADCGIPDEQLFEKDDPDDMGNIASLVAPASLRHSVSLSSVTASGMATGYGTSIKPNQNNTQAELEELNRRALAEAKEAKARQKAARERNVSSTAFGQEEFISLESLATDLCDLAIRKG
jgi:hypothetical protein